MEVATTKGAQVNKCVICEGELKVLRAITDPEVGGDWLVQCTGSCQVLQTITNDELAEEPGSMRDFYRSLMRKPERPDAELEIFEDENV